jgi:hypothetical protein
MNGVRQSGRAASDPERLGWFVSERLDHGKATTMHAVRASRQA